MFLWVKNIIRLKILFIILSAWLAAAAKPPFHKINSKRSGPKMGSFTTKNVTL